MTSVVNPVQSDNNLLLKNLHALLGERVSTVDSVLQQHGRGESWHPVQAPDVVVFAQSTEEVSQIVRYCAESSPPVIAYGTRHFSGRPGTGS